MADTSLSTRVSRRSMLAGGVAAALPGGGGAFVPSPAASFAAGPDLAGAAAGEARIALLGARYRRVTAALVDWVEAAERRHGPLAYERRPAYRRRYEALVRLDRACTAALARARPASLRGLVLKLRPAFYCDSLYDAEPDCDADILIAALHDLERLAGWEGGAGDG